MHREATKKKTRIAVTAIGLFLAFIIAALSLNYLLSRRIEQQAVAINLAGRQRMLSQRLVKALLQIHEARAADANHQERLKELKLAFYLFDNTLRGFDVGHETRSGSGEELFLPAVTGPGARAAVSSAVAVWKDYRTQITPSNRRRPGSRRRHHTFRGRACQGKQSQTAWPDERTDDGTGEAGPAGGAQDSRLPGSGFSVRTDLLCLRVRALSSSGC